VSGVVILSFKRKSPPSAYALGHLFIEDHARGIDQMKPQSTKWPWPLVFFSSRQLKWPTWGL
jgi:hypothetical protein